MALGFSQSAEFVNKMGAAIHNGVWVGDLNAGIAARFYDTVFSRLPDADGLDTWTKALNGGAPACRRWPTASSPRRSSRPPTARLNNDAFVELMYHNVLGRGSDAPGKATWIEPAEQRRNPRRRGGRLLGKRRARPADLAPHIDDGVWVV